jgi:hypothetical protein
MFVVRCKRGKGMTRLRHGYSESVREQAAGQANDE